MTNPISRPEHYTHKKLECREMIAIMTEGIFGEEAFNLGCIIKYLYRYRSKDDPIKDLRKTQQYIDFLIELIEAEEAKRRIK